MRKGGTVNMTGMGKQIGRLRQFKRAASAAANHRVQIAKREMLQEFTSHPVTKEVEGGASAENISNTLGGAGSDANLSTFIGFSDTGNPTSSIKSALNEQVYVSSVSTRAFGQGGKKVMADVRVAVPTAESLRELSPLPWEPGKSWLTGIEDGISGFGHYMYKKFLAGRSKFGLQSKHKVRNSSFRPVPYISTILKKFMNRLKSIR